MEESSGRRRRIEEEKFAFDFVLELIRFVGCNTLSEKKKTRKHVSLLIVFSYRSRLFSYSSNSFLHPRFALSCFVLSCLFVRIVAVCFASRNEERGTDSRNDSKIIGRPSRRKSPRARNSRRENHLSYSRCYTWDNITGDSCVFLSFFLSQCGNIRQPFLIHVSS